MGSGPRGSGGVPGSAEPRGSSPPGPAEWDTPERQWADLAAAGVLAAGLPEALGGAGLGLLEHCSVLAEIGRAVSDVPYLASIVLGAGAIAEFGSPSQQRQWVVPAGQGSVVLTAALAEEDGDDPRVPSASATRRNGRWVLSGVKTAVPAAPRADLFLVPASTADGVMVFLVEPSDAGVTVEPQQLTDFAEAGRVVLDGVTLDDDRVLGAGRAGRGLAGGAGHRGAVRGAVRGHRAGAGADRGVRAEPGSVRPADRLVPGGDAAAGRRLHRHRSGPAHHVAGRLAAGFRGRGRRRGSSGRDRGGHGQVLGRRRRPPGGAHRGPRARRAGHRHVLPGAPLLRGGQALRVRPRRRHRPAPPHRRRPCEPGPRAEGRRSASLRGPGLSGPGRRPFPGGAGRS